MAKALLLTTVTNSIAALSVSGVTIKDVDEIPSEADSRECVLYPDPVGFIDNLMPERVSLGADLQNVTYTLNYCYCHQPIGAERNLRVPYAAMITKVVAIVNAIMNLSDATVTGAIDVTLASGLRVGAVQDAAENWFYGAIIPLNIVEFQDG